MGLNEIAWGGMDQIDVAWMGHMVGFCEHGNESSSSVHCLEFLDLLRKFQLLKKDPFSQLISIILCLDLLPIFAIYTAEILTV